MPELLNIARFKIKFTLLTRVLNQVVKRNIERFPDDFMFQLSKDEFNSLKSQFVISNNDKMGLRRPSSAFLNKLRYF